MHHLLHWTSSADFSVFITGTPVFYSTKFITIDDFFILSFLNLALLAYRVFLSMSSFICVLFSRKKIALKIQALTLVLI